MIVSLVRCFVNEITTGVIKIHMHMLLYIVQGRDNLFSPKNNIIHRTLDSRVGFERET